MVRVQPSHRREQLRPINLRCLVPSRLNRHRPENRRPEAAIVTRRARFTGRWLSVSGERKSAFQVARIRSPGESICSDRRHIDQDDKPSNLAERRPSSLIRGSGGRSGALAKRSRRSLTATSPRPFCMVNFRSGAGSRCRAAGGLRSGGGTFANCGSLPRAVCDGAPTGLTNSSTSPFYDASAASHPCVTRARPEQSSPGAKVGNRACDEEGRHLARGERLKEKVRQAVNGNMSAYRSKAAVCFNLRFVEF